MRQSPSGTALFLWSQAVARGEVVSGVSLGVCDEKRHHKETANPARCELCSPRGGNATRVVPSSFGNRNSILLRYAMQNEASIPRMRRPSFPVI